MALHLNSPRLHKQTDGRELYDILRNTRVYTTEGISSELRLSQNGKLHTYVKERSELHIRVQGSQLEIFVPRNKKRQDFCYSSKLNSRLLEWLMTDPDTNITENIDTQALLTVQRLLNCTGSVLKDILVEDGIITGDVEDLDEYDDSEDEEDPEEDEADDPLMPEVSQSSQSSPILHHRDISSVHQLVQVMRTSSGSEDTSVSMLRSTALQQVQSSDDSIHEEGHVAMTNRSHFGDVARPISLNHESAMPDVAYSYYTESLRRVVTAARSAHFPRKDIFDLSSIRTALQGTLEFRVPSSLDPWKAIGAAGELYVSGPYFFSRALPEMLSTTTYLPT